MLRCGGVAITFRWRASAESTVPALDSGSSAKTSMPARMSVESRAAIRAASSTTSPLAVLIRMESGFMAARNATSTMPTVPSPPGTCNDTMSLAASTEARSGRVCTPMSLMRWAAARDRGLSSVTTRSPQPAARWATSRPMAPIPMIPRARSVQAAGLAVGLLVPVARPDVGGGRGDVAVDGEHEAQRQFGHGDGIAARDVAHVHAELRGPGAVDRVGAGTGAHHQPEVAAGFDGLGRHPGAAHHEHVVAGDMVGEILGGEGGLQRADVAAAAQPGPPRCRTGRRRTGFSCGYHLGAQ